MSNLPIRKRNYTTSTKMHVAALSLTTVFLSLLTGAIGYQAGKKSVPVSENDTQLNFLPNIEQQATLEALLHEIDQAQNQGADSDYLFPDELLTEEPLPIPEDPISESEATNVLPTQEEIEIPILPTEKLPTSGWSIQVGSYPNSEEAVSKAESMKASYASVYTVTASLEGETWYRVRIAGYPTKAAALEGKRQMESQNQEFDYLVFKSP
jgi:cell division protein FtsN